MKRIILFLVLCLMVAGPIYAGDILQTITGNVLSVPGTSDAISVYSLKKGCVEIGAGYGFLSVTRVADIDIGVLGTQTESTLGLNIGFPLQNMKQSVLTLIWPGLANLDAGAFLGWGYSFKTDDNGNTFFAWSGIDFGLSLTLKY